MPDEETKSLGAEIKSVVGRVDDVLHLSSHEQPPGLPPIMYDPVLPANAADAAARSEALEKAREVYVWDWSWPPGCATLSTLPDRDKYAPPYVARITELVADIDRNHIGQAFAGTQPLRQLAPLLDSEALVKHFLEAVDRIHSGAPKVRPTRIAGYLDYYVTLPRPPLVDALVREPASADALYAWQRVGGANPMSLARIARLPDDFALTEAHWTTAIGGGSLAEALADARVYAVDFSFLHDAPATRYLHRQKYISGARGIFATPGGPLRPVAIQLEPSGRIFTPADGVAWQMARYCLQVADANVHETMAHLGTTHMVMEAVGVAGRRHLADTHPLRILLEAHIEGTFAINHSAKTSLVAPGGVIDKVFAARIDIAAHLVRIALDGFVLQDRAPALELKARGVDDPSRLAAFPYRDDVLPVYAAIKDFVAAYVRLYYADDASVAADIELKAWVSDVGSPIGGSLKGIRPVRSFDALVEWMTNIVHIASAQHAAVNFPQFPFFGYVANVAGACWGPPPTEGPVTDADLLALMPPWDCSLLQANSVYQLSGVHYNQLGVYRPFSDPRVQPVVDAFQRALKAVEETIAVADQGRLLTYPYLRPSGVPASINI